jgi:hypothetical protein
VTSTWCNHGPAAVPGEPGVNRVSEKWYRVSQVWPGSYSGRLQWATAWRHPLERYRVSER